jgi:hypothetical protein
MTTDDFETNKHLVPVHRHDGFDDCDDEDGSLIRGTIIKFNNANEFLTKGEEEVISPDREFIVGDVLRVEQKWPPDPEGKGKGKGGKPQTRVLKPDESFRNLETLNNSVPKSEWRMKFGKLEGPYKNAHFAYLYDPKTLEVFTFITDTKGGHKCFKVLKENTRTARLVKGPYAFPVATLRDVFFTENYGGKQRPDFKIKYYLIMPPEAPAQIASAHEGSSPKEIGRDNALNDDLPSF